MDARVKRYIVEDIIPHYIRADLDAIPHMTDEQKEAFLKLFEKNELSKLCWKRKLL